MSKKIFLLLSLLLIILVAYIGCTKKPASENFGNQPPETYIVNVPPKDTLIYHARIIYWYGTDVDGKVIRYDWAIDDTAYSANILGSGWHSLYVDSTLATQDTIAFAAPIPDSIFTHTFYVRAVDNNGLPDPTPDHRVFRTNNIPPNTRFVTVPQDSSQRFILADTTNIWTGINVEWTAIDSDGVFPCQFEYCWDDTTQNFDPVTHKGWSEPINEESYYFTGANSPYEEGYHTLYIRAIDDAGARDQSLRDIINIDTTVSPPETTYYNQWVTIYFVIPEVYTDSSYRKILWINFATSANNSFVKPFYHSIFEDSLNLSFDSLNYSLAISDSIDHKLFGEYSTIIWSKDDKTDWADHPLDKKLNLITDYLHAGGRMIFTGSKVLNMGQAFAPGVTFGLRGLFPFSELHINKYDNISAGSASDTAISPVSSDTAFYSEDSLMPEISLGNNTTLPNTTWWILTRQWLIVDVLDLDLWGEYDGKVDVTYSINHYRNNAQYEGQPCATRFTYSNKTMPTFFYFGFPLSYLKYDSGAKLLREVLTELDELH